MTSIVVSLAIGGIAAAQPASDADQTKVPAAEKAVEAFFQQLAKQEFKAAEKILMVPLNDERVARRKSAILRAISKQKSNAGKVTIFDSHLRGDLAVVVYGTEGAGYRDGIDIDPVFLRQQDGAWKIILANSARDLLTRELNDTDDRRRAKRLLDWYATREKQLRLERQQPPQDQRPTPNPSDPVFTRSKIRDTPYVRQRLMNGLDPNRQNHSVTNQDYLLTYAVRHGAESTVKMLLEAGAIVDSRSRGLGKTALFQAAFQNQPRICKLLIAHGADVNAVDSLGNNALREAILTQHPNTVATLLEAGCRMDQQNQDGETMYDLAMKHGSAEVKALFASD